ncbi:hypothetical protein BGZ76_001049 [Entomortierella beljakovae]|nr:hypothetical protein BGZ76_001049 [Entomortierella beljakovae]
MVFCQILGTFLFSIVGTISLANRRAGQCLDDINPATQQNNFRCAVQGTMQVFGAVLFCVWVAAVTINLHVQAVWNSAWFARNSTITHTLCWGLTAAITIATLAKGEIQWNTGSYCFIAQSSAPAIFFYPMAVVLLPSFLIHIWTIIHISRIMFQNGSIPSAASRSTVSGSGAPSISHYQHVITIVKIQWRAALMASLSILFVMFYWIFYIFQFNKMNPSLLNPKIETYFIKCLSGGGDQNTCADVLAPYLPPFFLMIFAEVLVSAAGTTSFIVFFKPSFVREWRECFGMVRYRGKKADEEEFVAM